MAFQLSNLEVLMIRNILSILNSNTDIPCVAGGRQGSPSSSWGSLVAGTWGLGELALTGAWGRGLTSYWGLGLSYPGPRTWGLRPWAQRPYPKVQCFSEVIASLDSDDYPTNSSPPLELLDLGFGMAGGSPPEFGSEWDESLAWTRWYDSSATEFGFGW
eukprot:gene4524-2319_t